MGSKGGGCLRWGISFPHPASAGWLSAPTIPVGLGRAGGRSEGTQQVLLHTETCLLGVGGGPAQELGAREPVCATSLGIPAVTVRQWLSWELWR